jgi:hypothetical protein
MANQKLLMRRGAQLAALTRVDGAADIHGADCGVPDIR